ncbi:MAG: terpene cyclase/mutase family protein [Chthoniobacter sp.]|nr:terpene cyclase/mutase family protein [Chthoniobacter sp.]
MNQTSTTQFHLSLSLTSGRRAVGTLAAGLALFVGTIRAQADTVIDPKLKQSASFLLTQQKPGGEFGPPFPIAMTSLSIMALAACGHQPADPTPEGQAMRKGLDFILKPENQRKDGYFGSVDNSRMYGHGITTLMLAEMAGMGADDKQDALIREKLKLGVQLILRAQSVRKDAMSTGGWHYEPDAASADLSVTCWQTMAMRAAQNAGVDVPKEAVDNVVGYMKRMSQKLPGPTGPEALGGFGYSSPGTATSTTSEGLLAMQVCGQYEAAETIAAGNHLLKSDINKAEHYFYTLYYYAQGMYQRGGKYAETSKRLVPELLLPKQKPDGSFEGQDEGGGKVYTTTMSVLALAVKNHFLPIYQR